MKEITSTMAALRLGITRERVVRRIQRRELQGRLDAERGWLVDEACLPLTDEEGISPAAPAVIAPMTKEAAIAHLGGPEHADHILSFLSSGLVRMNADGEIRVEFAAK